MAAKKQTPEKKRETPREPAKKAPGARGTEKREPPSKKKPAMKL